MIGGSSGISLGPHVVDQPRYVLTSNLVEGETTEGGQDVDAQECFVGVPTPLAGLGVGQVAVADELVERWDGPQFLATSLRVGTKQGLGERRAAHTSSLLNREDIGGAKLELTLTPAPRRHIADRRSCPRRIGLRAGSPSARVSKKSTLARSSGQVAVTDKLGSEWSEGMCRGQAALKILKKYVT